MDLNRNLFCLCRGAWRCALSFIRVIGVIRGPPFLSFPQSVGGNPGFLFTVLSPFKRCCQRLVGADLSAISPFPKGGLRGIGLSCQFSIFYSPFPSALARHCEERRAAGPSDAAISLLFLLRRGAWRCALSFIRVIGVIRGSPFLSFPQSVSGNPGFLFTVLSPFKCCCQRLVGADLSAISPFPKGGLRGIGLSCPLCQHT